MTDSSSPEVAPGLSAAEAEKMQAAFKDIAERSQKLLAEFAERYQAQGPQPVATAEQNEGGHTHRQRRTHCHLRSLTPVVSQLT